MELASTTRFLFAALKSQRRQMTARALRLEASR